MSDLELFDLMNEFEDLYHSQGYDLIVGMDEVGRGPLAGPLVVCGVILDKPIMGLKDSKKISKKNIPILANQIIGNCHSYYLAIQSVEDIEKKGIKGALMDAYYEIVNNTKGDFYLIDYEKIEHEKPSLSITKGDSKSNSIAAASIVAKNHRDNLLKEIALKHPEYGFETNAGYGTKKHLEAIEKYGIIKGVHRRNFKPISNGVK